MFQKIALLPLLDVSIKPTLLGELDAANPEANSYLTDPYPYLSPDDREQVPESKNPNSIHFSAPQTQAQISLCNSSFHTHPSSTVTRLCPLI
jgi:hypothetical protein